MYNQHVLLLTERVNIDQLKTILNFANNFKPQISRFFGISIYMYAKDHYPAHFHAIYGEEEAMIDIKSRNIIKGELSNRALKLIQEWVELNEQELLDNFEETQLANPKIKLIEPLK